MYQSHKQNKVSTKSPDFDSALKEEKNNRGVPNYKRFLAMPLNQWSQRDVTALSAAWTTASSHATSLQR